MSAASAKVRTEPRIWRGHVDDMFYADGMAIRFADPCPSIRRKDQLRIKAPDGDLLDMMVASVHSEGEISVWYAPHPLLRHWLGRLIKQDERTWTLRMEPYHLDILSQIPRHPPDNYQPSADDEHAHWH